MVSASSHRGLSHCYARIVGSSPTAGYLFPPPPAVTPPRKTVGNQWKISVTGCSELALNCMSYLWEKLYMHTTSIFRVIDYAQHRYGTLRRTSAEITSARIASVRIGRGGHTEPEWSEGMSGTPRNYVASSAPVYVLLMFPLPSAYCVAIIIHYCHISDFYR